MTSVPFAISLVFVMYSYSGWNAATYIIGEIQEPNRSLPRALFLGTLIVTVLYVGLNAVFLAVTPIQDLAGQVDVAMIAGTHLFGEVGGRIVGMLICLGLVSSISAMMWIGPRVTMAMGEDMPLLRAFSRRSEKGVPANAIIFQLAISTLLLASQSFDAVLDFIQFSLTFCSFFTVLGVITLRMTHPKLPRPYRAWGYPVTPLVFLAVMLWMMYYLVVSRPIQSLAGFAMMLAGLAIYALSLFLSKSMSADTPKRDGLNRRSFEPPRSRHSHVSESIPLTLNACERRPMKLALFVSLLALSTAPAFSAEIANPNDTARFLAGLPVAADSPIAPLTNDSVWQAHASPVQLHVRRRRTAATCRRSVRSPRNG